MPIHYPDGVLKEHRHTRSAASLFDVSHLGQIRLRAKSGNPADAATALEALMPADVLSLATGRQRYAILTNNQGGIRDFVMIGKLGAHFYLVVNAACAQSDLLYLQAQLAATCVIESLESRSLLALQGPEAAAALCSLIPAAAAMRFMDMRVLFIDGAECLVTRSGYTGEDGFEISVPHAAVERIADRLLAHPSVELAGLGARETLRLEAGLCLHGHDITADTTPVEAGLEWAISRARRAVGERPGGFPGSGLILSQLQNGAEHCRVGLRPETRPVRGGAELFGAAKSCVAIGAITSGHLWAHREWAGGDGLCADRSDANRHAPVRRRGRRTHSSSSCGTALPPASLSSLATAARKGHQPVRDRRLL
jgi:aminomethyltransferase